PRRPRRARLPRGGANLLLARASLEGLPGDSSRPARSTRCRQCRSRRAGMTAWVPSWSGSAGAAEATADGIAAWACSDALGQLVRLWGGQRLVEGDTESLLEWLDAVSAEHWDFRRGRERNLAASAVLSPEQAAAVLQVAPELGLVSS